MFNTVHAATGNEQYHIQAEISQAVLTYIFLWDTMKSIMIDVKAGDGIMLIQDKMQKPMLEAKYLNVENTDRYRPIMRLFYLQYEKLKYWMYQEEVYEELKENPEFAGYTMEQCQQDLTALKEWGNLLTIQDTRKVTSIEEFKSRKFRYQLSEISVEIERMVLRIENLFIEGSSLEPSLLERIRDTLEKTEEMAGEESIERIHGWWDGLTTDFVRLNQNYQDYMRELNSVRAEEMMKTREFLLFKDRLIEYLRSFVKSLQMHVPVIEERLKKTDAAVMEKILAKETEYELSIPRLEAVEEKLLSENIRGRWKSILEWFSGSRERESEAGKVFDTTNDIIRRITRYATRISEMSNQGANRREEYRKLSELFYGCRDIYEAHRLSAMVFGMERPLHLKGEFRRETDSINSRIYEENPHVVTLRPRVRYYREKARRSAVIDYTEEKETLKAETIRRQKEERELWKTYIKDGRLVFASLPVIEPAVRDVFLLWLSKALENKSHRAKTEDGQMYRIEDIQVKHYCILQCTDGSLWMPAYTLVFE